MPLSRSLGAVAAALLAFVGARPARACAVCGAGDPTLNVAGTEKPYDGRLRISGDLRAGGARVGSGAGQIDVHEQRLDLGVAYAPVASLFLTLSVPLLHRDAADGGGMRKGAWTPGDVDLRAKGFILRSLRGGFTHEVALLGGIRLPTAPVQSGPSGMPLPAALQPGGSSVTPLAGASYDLRRGPWFFYASATFFVPFAVRGGTHACDSLRVSTSLQYQPHRVIATRLGLDGRLESSAVTDRASDPNAGGFIGYVSPEIVVSPKSDLVLLVGARFPLLQALRGVHREDTIVSIGAAYDLR
ncbi:MAG: hypothetical protein QM820_55865 [Minicystis sp.]